MKRRILAILLAVVLLAGMMPAALAANLPEADKLLDEPCPGSKNADSPDGYHSFSGSTQIERTCTSPGGYLEVCEWCGKKALGEYEPALGHKWGQEKVTKEATCTNAGEKTKTCSRCGRKQTEKIDKKAHKWGEWTVLAEPTDRSTGLREHTCTVCATTVQETFYPDGTIMRGGNNDKSRVTAAQEALNAIGFNCGEADGIFGAKTEQAAAAFKAQYLGEENGILFPHDQLYLLSLSQEADSDGLTAPKQAPEDKDYYIDFWIGSTGYEYIIGLDEGEVLEELPEYDGDMAFGGWKSPLYPELGILTVPAVFDHDDYFIAIENEFKVIDAVHVERRDGAEFTAVDPQDMLVSKYMIQLVGSRSLQADGNVTITYRQLQVFDSTSNKWKAAEGQLTSSGIYRLTLGLKADETHCFSEDLAVSIGSCKMDILSVSGREARAAIMISGGGIPGSEGAKTEIIDFELTEDLELKLGNQYSIEGLVRLMTEGYTPSKFVWSCEGGSGDAYRDGVLTILEGAEYVLEATVNLGPDMKYDSSIRYLGRLNGSYFAAGTLTMGRPSSPASTVKFVFKLGKAVDMSRDTYYERLNEYVSEGENPLEDPNLRDTVEGLMSEWGFSEEEIDYYLSYIEKAEGTYRDLWLYSVFDVEVTREPGTGTSRCSGDEITLREDVDIRLEFGTFAHEFGHAIDNLTGYLRWDQMALQYDLYDELYKDMMGILGASATASTPSFCSDTYASVIIGPDYRSEKDGTPVYPDYPDDKLADYTTVHSTARERGDGWPANDSYMCSDINGGMTNLTLYTSPGHFGKTYWYSAGSCTYNQCKEAWAEFSAAYLTNDANAIAANYAMFPNACAFMEECAEMLLENCREKHNIPKETEPVITLIY